MKSGFGNNQNKKRMFENLQIAAGFAVICLCVLTFIFYRQNRYMFAVCFFAAALMNLFAGCQKNVPGYQRKRETAGAVFWFICAAFFALIGVAALFLKF